MKLRFVAVGALSAALALTACGGQQPNQAGSTTQAASNGNNEQGSSGKGSSAQGTLTGMGASSMRVAQEAWISAFTAKNAGVKISYAAEGSGAGRNALTDGSAQFAGSDRAFKLDKENKAGNFKACASDSIALDLPVYISPIAIVFKLDGVKELNMDAHTLAKIFKGEIAKWNDPAIAKLNPDAKLPDQFITVVHRSDTSGTTENLAQYLAAVAPDVWDAEISGDWPYKGQGAQHTDGVQSAVNAGNGTIGYVDASAAEGLSIMKLGKDGKFFGPDSDSAAKIVENSPYQKGRAEHDLAVELDRKSEGYPVVLISYALVCQKYQDKATADLVKSYLTWITSEEGQKLAHEQSGSAPLSAKLRDDVTKAIESISG